ncbi:MAG: hypothetical protein GY876_04325 [Planctomycetes bacterium]|nr:hypothetical protein [Planctomycetota bacterium]
MLTNVAVILVIALLAYWWSNQGFLSALLHFICVVCAAAVAFAWWEPLGFDIMLGTSKWGGLAPGSALLLLFLVSLLLLRSISDKIVIGNTRIPRPVDLTGGAIIGAGAGVITAGMLVIGTGFIAIPAGTGGHTGWSTTLDGGVHVEAGTGGTDQAKRLWIPVDWITASLFETVSTGSLHPDIGGTPMADWNPYLDRQATLLRTRLETADPYAATQVFQAPGTVEVSPMLRSVEENGTTWWMFPLKFSKKGMDLQRSVAIGPTQVRLVGTTDDGTAIQYPQYWSQTIISKNDENGSKVSSKGFFQFANESPYFYGTSRDEADITLLFGSQDDSFTPKFLQIRGTRFDLPESREEADWEEFCQRVGATGSTTDSDNPWGGDISHLVDMRGSLPRGARPSIGDFQGGSPEFSERESRILRAEATRVGNKSRGKGKLRVGGYAIEKLVQLSNGEQERQLDKDMAIIKIRVGPGTTADIAKLARRMGGDGDIRLLDSEGGEYAPYGYELKNDSKTIISFNVPLSRWSTVRHRPKSESDAFSLIFVMPVDIALDRLMLDEERIGFFENTTAESPKYR